MAFTFNDKIKLEIEDKEFSISLADKKVTEAVVQLVNDTKDITSDEEAEKLADACVSFCKMILGDMEFEELFKDRVLSIYDLSDLSQYICNEIKDAKMKRFSQYASRN